MKCYTNNSAKPRAKVNWRGVLEDSQVMKSVFTKLILSLSDGLTKERCIATHLFWRSCKEISGKSGLLFLALYLKQCKVIIMKLAAKDVSPIELSPYISLTGGGVPRIIPSFHRKKVAAGCHETIKLYLSLCSVAKIISLAPRVTKSTFSSLLDECSVPNVVDIINQEFDSYFTSLTLRYIPGVMSMPLYTGISFTPTWKALPTTRQAKQWLTQRERKSGVRSKRPSSRSCFTCFPLELAVYMKSFMCVAVHDAAIFFSGPLWYPSVLFPLACDSNEDIMYFNVVEYFNKLHGNMIFDIPVDQGQDGLLAQVLPGEGKRRLFAIGNYIKQRLLYPFHCWLADCLRTIPMDGTFDQLKPLRLLKGSKGCVHSIDLKAATDRWPASLLYALTLRLFGGSFAASAVLCALYSNSFQPTFTKSACVAFVVGQPLGYYSSWPLFAFSHHMVVWIAAEHVYPGKIFRRYALLGDDIVIADTRVAEEYKRLVSLLGVQVSPSKTLVSETGAAEFAKRFFVDRVTVDLSPYSIKQISRTNTARGWYSYLNTVSGSLRFSTLMRIAGFGFKARSREFGSVKHRKRARHYSLLFLHHCAVSRGWGMRMSLHVHCRKWVSPSVIGVLTFRLLTKLAPRELEPPPTEAFFNDDAECIMEYTLYRGWMKSYLAYVKWYATSVTSPDVTLDELLKPPVYRHQWYADPAKEDSPDSVGLPLLLYKWCEVESRRQHLCFPVKESTDTVPESPLSSFDTSFHILSSRLVDNQFKDRQS